MALARSFPDLPIFLNSFSMFYLEDNDIFKADTLGTTALLAGPLDFCSTIGIIGIFVSDLS